MYLRLFSLFFLCFFGFNTFAYAQWKICGDWCGIGTNIKGDTKNVTQNIKDFLNHTSICANSFSLALSVTQPVFGAHEEDFQEIQENACGEGSPVMASNAFRLLADPGHYVRLDFDQFEIEVQRLENTTAENNQDPGLFHALSGSTFPTNQKDMPLFFICCSPQKALPNCSKDAHYGLLKKGCCFERTMHGLVTRPLLC